ncbi:MAG: hydroxysqualene dehydroxylase HpnE [Gammaproteobacteria bacterium]
MKAQVAVVGGGWAGCAAALALAEAGVAVTLFEAARTLGGRARAVELEGAQLDNGQHILLGAYEQTLALIGRLQPEVDVLWRLPLTLEQPPNFRLACPRLPAPLHLAAGLLTAHGLSFAEKWAAARWADTLIRNPTHTLPGSVADLTRAQPGKLNRLLWHPLCVSALNTSPEEASAQVFADVLRAAFGGRRHHSDLLLPRRDLGALLPVPAAARVAALGGDIRLGQRVGALDVDAHGVTLLARNAREHYSHVIVAVAPQHLPALASGVDALAAAAAGVARYVYRPIATAYVQYDDTFRLPTPLYALDDGPAQFVFDRGQSHDQAGLVAFVASAVQNLAEDWVAQAEAQLRRIVDPGPARWRRRIVEKQATYACVPDLPRPDVRTPHPRVFLAGDYTAGPYPATLESATASGVQSARALLESL